ncbi:dihydroxyacetone kinase phosphoryl donor subunit DhaM [Marinactinospora rubrisoli]|uniref:phosphoenolpyruvate--glycerone phosphotransferase n=1 Tax=Marinactinospora rubrisoli TaxID=2715399 RepID=A0ABW2KMS5_9ACTN
MNPPVGIVLVSHSHRLAEGLRDLLAQLVPDTLPLATAGGTEDGGIGTSHDLVAAAVRRADGGAGVVVIPDLGSAVLTARTVLADLDRPQAVLVDAPFVEGAVAAAMTASAGAGLAEVVAAAHAARGADKF